MNTGWLSLKNLLFPAVICIIVFICFSYSLHNSFTNWDDDVYVTNNKYINALTPENLKVIFTEDITKNNFHPLCMLSLAFNYYFSQLNPETYYLTNILIHIANVVLVFLLSGAVCRRLGIEQQGSRFISSFTALWFGIHPMHVESVSWIAERKDVLYAFFYFAGLFAYIKYTGGRQKKWYIATLILFVASCLSKPMAVVFPLSLLCLDLLFEGRLDRKMLTGKIPFFAGALIFGGLAYYTQNKTGAIAPFGALTLSERIMYASYGFMMYVVKLFNPSFLSTFYPYPYRYLSGLLPWEYYAAPFISVAIIALPLYFAYKHNRFYFRVLLFGLAFFLVNIIFVLQLISCGAAIMADRYSYVSYTGLFFMLAFFSRELMQKIPSYKITVMAALLGVSGWWAYTCSMRTRVWHNSETLLKDAIAKFPYRALLSYKWLGNYFYGKGEWDSALVNYLVLTQLNAADARIYDNVGNIFRMNNDYEQALEAFGKSLQVQNNVYRTYLDMSITYSLTGDSANAMKYFITSYRMYPASEKIYADTAFNLVQRKQYGGCLIMYGALLTVNQSNPFYYFYRGVAQFGTGRLQPAIGDWLAAVKFKARDASPAAAYNLAVAYDSIGDGQNAVFYANLSKEMGYSTDLAYINRLKLKWKKK